METIKNTHPDIGSNIRKLRELRNYTQQYVADRLELSVTQYGKLEREESWSTKYLYKIADILETTVQKILNFDGQQYFEIHNNKEVHTFGNIEHVHHGQGNEEQQLLIALMKRLIEKMG